MKNLRYILLGIIVIVGMWPAWEMLYYTVPQLFDYYPISDIEAANIALKNNDVTVCDRIMDSRLSTKSTWARQKRLLCYEDIARDTTNIEMCLSIPFEDLRSTCNRRLEETK